MTLRGKIVALVVGVTLAIVSALWVVLSGSWGGWTADAVDRDLLGRAGAIAGLVEAEHGGLEIEHADDAPALRDPAHPYRIVGPGGAVLGTSGYLPWPAADPGASPRVTDVPGADGRRWRVVSAPLAARHGDGDARARITVQVAGDAAPYGALEERFRRGLLVTLAAALLVGAVGAAALARASLAPLRRLADEVAAIGAASVDRRLSTSGLDPELRRLASAFNGLLARLEDAMKAQRQLVSRASHALRTPVATMLTRSEVALRRERDPVAYRAALEDVAAAARESSTLVAHLLTLSRLDERRGAVAREEVPVVQVAAEVARLVSPRAQEAGVALEVDVAEGLVAMADRGALREALDALVDNAVRYTPRGGRAGVRGLGTADGAAISVWDTGPGIPPEERARVLERFHRGTAAQASGQPGSGLGLAIVKAIADAHGASLSLGDRAGGGLEVKLVLPGAPPSAG